MGNRNDWKQIGDYVVSEDSDDPVCGVKDELNR